VVRGGRHRCTGGLEDGRFGNRCEDTSEEESIRAGLDGMKGRGGPCSGCLIRYDHLNSAHIYTHTDACAMKERAPQKA
jgi:hypothetical protein